MINVTPNVSYSPDFISSIKDTINQTLAKTVNKMNSNRKFDLDLNFNKEEVLKLTRYNQILERVLKCDSCYKDMNAADIVDVVKTTINRI